MTAAGIVACEYNCGALTRQRQPLRYQRAPMVAINSPPSRNSLQDLNKCIKDKLYSVSDKLRLVSMGRTVRLNNQTVHTFALYRWIYCKLRM